MKAEEKKDEVPTKATSTPPVATTPLAQPWMAEEKKEQQLPLQQPSPSTPPPASPSKPSSAQPWAAKHWQIAVGAAVVISGLGGLAYRQFAPKPGTPYSMEAITATGSMRAGVGEEPESMEDALKALEEGDAHHAHPGDHADFFSSLHENVEVVEAHEAARGKDKKKKKGKKGAAPEEEPKQKKRRRGELHGEEMDAALLKLEVHEDDGEQARKEAREHIMEMYSHDHETAHEIVEKAVKTKRSKSKKPATEKESLRDTLKTIDEQEAAQPKVKGKGPKNMQGEDLRHRLDKLLSSEEEAKSKKKGKKGDDNDDDGSDHMDFVKLLKEEADRKHEHTLDKVKTEFKSDFGAHSKELLCGGCKLVAARLDTELDTHDVHESESPAKMLVAKRTAMDSACHSFRHLHVVDIEGRYRFEAGEEAPEGGPGQPGAAQRLCTALLEETRFEALTKLIQKKVPQGGMFSAHSEPQKDNWERWLCAQRTRVCKNKEVRDDFDVEHEL